MPSHYDYVQIEKDFTHLGPRPVAAKHHMGLDTLYAIANDRFPHLLKWKQAPRTHSNRGVSKIPRAQALAAWHDSGQYLGRAAAAQLGTSVDTLKLVLGSSYVKRTRPRAS